MQRSPLREGHSRAKNNARDSSLQRKLFKIHHRIEKRVNMLKKLLSLLKSKKKEFLPALEAIFAVVLLYAFFHISGIGCPIHFATGISCPGCGMTRAFFSFIRFRFADAFHYHPLVYVMPLIVLILLIKRHISKRFYQILMFTFIVLFVSIYLVRMCDPTNDIVEFHPEQGFIFRTITYFIKIRGG